MANQKLKGVLGTRGKSSSLGTSCSQTAKRKRITDLEILARHLQHRLRLYEDPMDMENLMEDIDEEIVRSSELQGFLERKKAKDKHARVYDYHRRYDDY